MRRFKATNGEVGDLSNVRSLLIREPSVGVGESLLNFTLILNVAGQPLASTFVVEILDSNGKRVWHGQRLGMGRDYSLNLTLARRMIPAGRYLIKLYGMRDGKQEPVADYPVQISY